MFVYQPNFLPSAIYLIGAGGTGSRLMPMMAQLVKTCLRAHNETGHLTKLDLFVIDGDTVEQKNLARQNFIAKDVGQYKAVVLANRYSAAFNIPIYASTDYIKETGNPAFIGTDMQVNWTNCVVILAVDSATARQEILKNIMSRDVANCFVIDAGNEDDFGQVRFFTLPSHLIRHSYDKNPMAGNPITNYKVDFIPFDFEYYDRLGTSAQELSCADLPQTLAINAMMATLICSTLQNFLYMKPVSFDCIRYSMTQGVSTEFNTAKRWYDRALVLNDITLDYDLPSGPPKVLGNAIQRFARNSTAFRLVSGSNSIFEKLYQDNFKAYKQAGMILERETGKLMPIEVPKPALKEVAVGEPDHNLKSPKKKTTRLTRQTGTDVDLAAVPYVEMLELEEGEIAEVQSAPPTIITDLSGPIRPAPRRRPTPR
jgi:molybdopterin/thiamine biosynthesis adenylyltransferase